ncbi:MAG: alpha-amylase family glycosyl hydrolase [Planctomycetota bacterium]
MISRDRLHKLYPNDVDRIEAGVEELLAKYASITPSDKPLSQRDAILITYGDAIRHGDLNPLEALRRFASEHLADAISAVHLLPCFPFTSDDGFSVQDYYQIDPALGDWQDIERLGDSFALMFDAVVNHASQACDWFQGFLAGDPALQDYFVVSDPELDYSSVTRPRALPLLHDYEKADGSTVHVWTTFSRDQVDLNYRSPEVFLQVLDVLLFYISRGARFIRLDAIAFIWKEIGTTCLHLAEAHEIIQLYRHFIERLAPQAVIITETNVPHEENISYFGDGSNEAHMVYNFTLPPLLMHSLHKQDVEVLTSWAQSLKLPSDEVCFFNFTASHDGVGVRPLQGIVSDDEIRELADIAVRHGGFVSMKDNGDGTESPYEINCNYLDFATAPDASTDERIQRFLLTQSVMLAMPGVPGIYYHSLLGSQNDLQAAIDSGINRRVNRAKLQLNELVKEITDETSLRSRVLSRYKAMLDARSSDPAFDPYGRAEYRNEGGVFVIRRDNVTTLHNFTDRHSTVELGTASNDLLTGETLPEHVELGPFEFRWLKQAN